MTGLRAKAMVHSPARQRIWMFAVFVVILMIVPSIEPSVHAAVFQANGYVRDAVSNWPVPGAQVELRGKKNTAVCDSLGYFDLGQVEADTLALFVTATGYRSDWGIYTDSRPNRLRLMLFPDTVDASQPLSVLRAKWLVASPYCALGREAADKDIARKTVSLPSTGLTSGYGIDDSTGFPIHPIAGCDVTDSIVGFEQGYRKRIRDWVQVNGIPNWSRKSWIEDLRSASGFFTKCSSENAPIRIGCSEDSIAISPNGRWRIFTCPDTSARFRNQYVSLMIEDWAGPLPPMGLMTCGRADKIEACWGPTGADVAVIHRFGVWKLGKATHSGNRYLIVDLRTGAVLRTETDY